MLDNVVFSLQRNHCYFMASGLAKVGLLSQTLGISVLCGRTLISMSTGIRMSRSIEIDLLSSRFLFDHKTTHNSNNNMRNTRAFKTDE